MLKKAIWLVVFVFMVMSGIVGISVHEAVCAQKVQDEIQLDNKYQNPKGYEASLLTHKKHSQEYKNEKGEPIKCSDCHHVYKDGKNSWKEGDHVDKCVKCHSSTQNLSPSKANKLSKEEQVKELSWAFHENCYNCHKAVKAVNKDANAPKSCAKCHKKIKK